MNIGKASRVARVSEKAIRKYEQLGLLPDIKRLANTYRDFSAEDVRRLVFIRRARDCGFSLAQVRSLLALWDDKARTCRDVRALMLDHAQKLDQRAIELQRLADSLNRMAEACDGSDKSDCNILQWLETGITTDAWSAP